MVMPLGNPQTALNQAEMTSYGHPWKARPMGPKIQRHA